MTNEVAAALIGSGCGSFGAALAGFVLYEGQRSRRIKSLCLGLAAELETIWKQHWRNCGEALTKVEDDKFWNSRYPLFSNYFTNYQANASDLGEIRDPELRVRVIRAYAELMGFTDSFRFMNQMLDEPGPAQGNRTPDQMNFLLQKQHAVLIDYTGNLKRQNAHLNTEIPALVTQLKNHVEIL